MLTSKLLFLAVLGLGPLGALEESPIEMFALKSMNELRD